MKFTDMNPKVIAQFRGGGKIDGLPEGAREGLLLLTTVGRRSGRRHTTPLGRFIRDGEIYLAAGNGGEPGDPHWYLNAKADPRVTVETSRETYRATLVEVDDEHRARLWPSFVAEHPQIAGYEETSGRVIPILRLARV
ncbi:nitroreductase/quinone reductase family protein [Kutzneria sp. NPDC052558]|uniref:nitroreductase/quinone reductase family protein n=1 Tax=Kutzneria sp. NPDC052558 TaxID=3364121 RepID=UPI0037CBBBFE